MGSEPDEEKIPFQWGDIDFYVSLRPFWWRWPWAERISGNHWEAWIGPIVFGLMLPLP